MWKGLATNIPYSIRLYEHTRTRAHTHNVAATLNMLQATLCPTTPGGTRTIPQLVRSREEAIAGYQQSQWWEQNELYLLHKT